MIIVVDLTSLADNFSGIERYALNITRNIIDQDKNNQYILVFKNSIYHEFLPYKHFSNVRMKVLKGGNKLVFNQLILPWELFRIKADKYLFLAFPSPILFFKKGVINTIHDLTCWDYPETMKRLSKWYFRLSIRNAILKSEGIISVSEFSKKKIIKKFGSEKSVLVAYNGVSDVFRNFNYSISEEENIKFKYRLPDQYLMCLCTLEPRKNIELLLDAYIELKQDNKISHKLLLVGRKGWKVEQLFEKIPKQYREDVIITGFIDDLDLPYIYLNADIFVFPSIYEGFGIPPIESLSMGTPVLVSDIPPLKEVCQNNGIFFRNKDKADLKSKILESLSCLNDIKVSHLKNQAFKFNWEIEAKKILDELIRK